LPPASGRFLKKAAQKLFFTLGLGRWMANAPGPESKKVVRFFFL
jgi:hypothetical protein